MSKVSLLIEYLLQLTAIQISSLSATKIGLLDVANKSTECPVQFE